MRQAGRLTERPQRAPGLHRLPDRLIPPRLTRALHAGIPGARLTEIEGGTHGLCYEFAERLNQELAGWLDAPEAAPRASVA